MTRMRIWRRVWHSRSTPSDASKSERSWRRLSKRLCYEECFDEMMRTCSHCGMFEEDDDILVQCQGPECSLRPYGIPGVFYGRCAEALGFSGGARWQNCPWCPPAAVTAPIAECLSPVLEASCAASASLEEYISWLDTEPAPDEEKYFCSMTRSQEVNYAALTIQRSSDIWLNVCQQESVPRRRRVSRRFSPL